MLPPSHVAGSLFGVAPIVLILLMSYLLAPRADPVGGSRLPLRPVLAVVRAVLAAGAFAVLTVEIAAAFQSLTATVIRSCWIGATAVAALTVAVRTYPRWRRRSTTQRSRSTTLSGAWRTATHGVIKRVRDVWRPVGRVERALIGTLIALVLGELLMALLAEPNNFDSQTYHLPRIEHWVLNRDVDAYPTAIHRQVTLAPGAEYLLLHLRLLTGGDTLYHLPQWAAGVLCLLVTSRIVVQLGGGRRAALITAFLVGTTPMVVTQASSTQNDLMVAAWTACVATLVLDGLSRGAGGGPGGEAPGPAGGHRPLAVAGIRATDVLALGTALGLTAVTKNSGLLAAGPLLLLWVVGQLRLPWPAGRTGAGAGESTTTRARRATPVRRARVTAAAFLGVLAVAAVLVGPFIGRMTVEFGHPLGPPRLRESIPMQRHDPPAVLVNALRIGHTALDTPVAPLRQATAEAISAVADVLRVDPQDRAITFGQTTFPVPAWYPDEDRVAFPIAGTLALVGTVLALARPHRLTRSNPLAAGNRSDVPGFVIRGYATVLLTAVVLYTATIKWQPWGNRLLLFSLVLATPLAGLWLDAVVRRAAMSRSIREFGRNDTFGRDTPGVDAIGRDTPDCDAIGRDTPGVGTAGRRLSVAPTAVTALIVATLTVSALAAALTLTYGFPRRLVGEGSVVTTSDWETRFVRRPQWAEEYQWAAKAVDAAGVRRIGLVQQNDNWEYPWWLLLRDHEIVALHSVVPGRPPADPTDVDAIVCTGKRKACQALVPAGWQLHYREYVGYALPQR